MEEKILLVDENNLLFRMVNVNQGLLFNKKKTGGIYGFITLLARYINLHKPDYLMVCEDSPPLIRRQEYAGYKASRKKLDQDYFSYVLESREYVHKFLDDLGIQRWAVTGYESDDLIGAICQEYWDREITICSNDDDLFQVLTSTTVLQRNKDVYTEKDFRAEYDIDPISWAIVKALSGNHNDVKPVYKGLGIKTAVKLAKDYSKLKEFMENDLYSEKVYENWQLTILPHPTFKSEWVPELTPRKKVTERDLENAIVKEYGIRPTSSMYEAFVI